MGFALAGIDAYDRALRDSPHVCLWQQPWWLDAVCPEGWQALCLTRGGRLVAALPYVEVRRMGFAAWWTPPLTKSLGPWLEPRTMKHVKWAAHETDALSQLAAAIPRHIYYSQTWSADRQNWLPFYWRGFRQTTVYTYRLDLTPGEEHLWQGLSESTRRSIRKAQSTGIRVSDDGDAKILHKLSGASFERQGFASPYSESVVARLVAESHRRKSGTVFLARTAGGEPCAAALVVRDAGTAYYVMGGADPSLRQGGVQDLLLWTSIRDSAKRVQTFDFEGSMVPSIERSFRGFGGRLTPLLKVEGSRNRAVQIAGRAGISLTRHIPSTRRS